MEVASLRMKQWLGINERNHVLPSDQWYLRFANQLYPIIKQSAYFGASHQREQSEAAILLSVYFQDTIAQNGGWKIFSGLYYSRYNAYLPFYSLTDGYLPDEINPEDIAFVLWTLKSRIATLEQPYTLQDPHDKDLLSLAQQVYELMDVAFEEAPICEEPSSSSWVMEPDLLKIDTTLLPEITPDTNLTQDAKRCLAYNNGKPLLYFATYKELTTFFVEVLKWENNPTSLLPDLKEEKEFVIYANAKGMMVACNVAAYFCETHNPMYNAERAAKEAHPLFCIPGACPFDLLKYGMTKGVLPDAQLPFPKGKEILHQHWDFIARYYLCDYYEGE